MHVLARKQRPCLTLLAALVMTLPPAYAGDIAASQAQQSSPSTSQELKALLDADLDKVFRAMPDLATAQGIPGYNHLLPDLSATALETQQQYERSTLIRLQAMDASQLQGQEKLSYELLRNKMEQAVAAQRFGHRHALVLSSLGGIQTMMPRQAQLTAFRSANDYQDYLARLRGIPKLVEQTMARLEQGRDSGWMRTTPVVDRIVAAIDAHMVSQADDSVVFGPFKRYPATVSEAQRQALADEARQLILSHYQPALQKLKTYLQTEYRPKAPAEAGLAALPGGLDYYNHLIRSEIAEGMSAAEIHTLGQQQVARLRQEIASVAKQTGFKGNTDQFVRKLGRDPRYFFKSSEAVLAAYRAMSQRVDPQLGKLFHALPRTPYAIRSMTAAEASSSTAANYAAGSLVLGTSGLFTINALGYQTEPTWRVESLFLHEAVPGHHMQIARAAEIEGLHPWRRMGGWNVAYGEGWALYAEKLGYAMGLYKDPYQHYGHLQAELFRAARLVVDTGIHAYKWPRTKAVDYMVRQGGLNQDFAESEVDRYFSNPSQALGYMIGQRKLMELRQRAEQALGDKFDIRDFHAVVLDGGRMPLQLLERKVDSWIAQGGGKA